MKSLCYGRLSHTYDEALFIISITSSRYRVATAQTQRKFMHMYNYAHTALHSNAITVQFNGTSCLSPDPFLIFEGGARQSLTIIIRIPWRCLFHGTERYGTERNAGLFHGTDKCDHGTINLINIRIFNTERPYKDM